jgi:hypothetical protein
MADHRLDGGAASQFALDDTAMKTRLGRGQPTSSAACGVFPHGRRFHVQLQISQGLARRAFAVLHICGICY